MEKQFNKKMLILQAFAIILVVIGHRGGIQVFADWFSIYSYHMPLFIFISGYFYKDENQNNIFKFILKKIKNLVIPYYIWAFIYFFIILILKRFNLPTYSYDIGFKMFFLEPWITGHQLGLNAAAWFVLSLFLVQVIYIIFRRLSHLKNEWILTAIFIIIGGISVLFANEGYNEGIYLTIVRTGFLIQFYQIGYLYKKKIENKFKVNNLVYFILLFIVQFLIIKMWGAKSFSAVFCNEFDHNNVFLPLLTSITGIMLWMKISELLLPILGENKLFNYIGKNTWTIMMHHQLVFYFINLGFLFISNFIKLDAFNYDAFSTNMWYAYNWGDDRFYIFYIILGIGIPLLIKKYSYKKICFMKKSFLCKSKTYNREFN